MAGSVSRPGLQAGRAGGDACLRVVARLRPQRLVGSVEPELVVTPANAGGAIFARTSDVLRCCSRPSRPARPGQRSRRVGGARRCAPAPAPTAASPARVALAGPPAAVGGFFDRPEVRLLHGEHGHGVHPLLVGPGELALRARSARRTRRGSMPSSSPVGRAAGRVSPRRSPGLRSAPARHGAARGSGVSVCSRRRGCSPRATARVPDSVPSVGSARS